MAKVRKKFKYKNKYPHGGVHDPAIDSFSAVNNNQSLANERLAFFANNQDTYDEQGQYNPIFSGTDVFEGPSGGAITPDNLPASMVVPSKAFTIPANAIGKPLMAALNKTPIPKYANAAYKATKETLKEVGIKAAKKIAPETTTKVLEYRAAKANPEILDRAMDAGNDFNKFWFENSATQRKINQSFGSSTQPNRPLQPFGDSMRRAIRHDGYKTSYPSLKATEDALDGIGNPYNYLKKGRLKRPIVPPNAVGVSYPSIDTQMMTSPRYNPVVDKTAMKSLHSNLRNVPGTSADLNLFSGQNFVSRMIPQTSPTARKMINIHEGAHGITQDGFVLMSDSSYETLAARMRKPFKKKGLQLNKDSKIIDYRVEGLNDISKQYDNYILDPQEIYSRVQEIRHHALLLPGEKVTGKQLQDALFTANGKKYAPGISKSVQTLIGKAKSLPELADLLNYLPATTGVAATGYGASKENNNNMKSYKKGGVYYGKPNYAKGGFFQRNKIGRGIRDLGVATLNTAASPFESILGTDFGIDEKYGYSTRLGQAAGSAGEFAGSAVGSLVPAALNTVAPGLGTAVQLGGQALGSGLEGAGMTKDITTDPESFAGSGIGTTLGMVSDFMPNSGVRSNVENFGQSKFIQGLSGMFISPPNPEIPSQKQGAMNSKYQQGGVTQEADIEAESGELILTGGGQPKSLNTNAGLNNLGNGAYEIKGTESHKKGGVPVKLPTGETVIVTNEKGRSSRVKQAYKKIAAANKKINSGDFIDAQTGELEKRNAEAAVQKEISEQQNDNGNQTNMAKYGGKYMKAENGARSIGPGEQLGANPSGVSFLNNVFNDKQFYGVGETFTMPGINRPEGISSSMYGLKFNPQSMPGMEPGAYSNMDRSMSLPIRGVQGQYEGRTTMPPRAQEGVVNYNMPAIGPYSNIGGQLFSGVQNMPNDLNGLPAFNRQMGFMNQQGNQTMYPEYQNQQSAMYNLPRAQESAISLPSVMPQQSAMNTSPIPSNMRVPMGNFGVGDSMASTSPYPQNDNKINLSQVGSRGVLMSDQNQAPVQGPVNQLQQIGLNRIPFEGINNPQNMELRGRSMNSNINFTPAYPGENRSNFDLGNIIPYASSAYNIGAGVAGLINPPEGLNATDYQMQGRMKPNRMDPYAMMAPQQQMAATFMNQTQDPRRKAAFAASMAPQTSNMFARTNYLNRQLEGEAQKYNLGIERYNKGIQGQVDKFNMGLEAMPYQMIQQGLGQAANTYLGMDRNNMLRDLSNTARFKEGNINIDYGSGYVKPGQIKR